MRKTRSPMMVGRMAALVVATWGAGCADQAASVVELPVWTLAVEPVLAVGAAEGNEQYLFGDIVSVLPFAGDGVLVADRQLAKLRVYDANGRHTADIGSVVGDGPNEFGSIARAVPYRGDSIAAFDDGNSRMAIIARRAESRGRPRSFSISPIL